MFQGVEVYYSMGSRQVILILKIKLIAFSQIERSLNIFKKKQLRQLPKLDFYQGKTLIPIKNDLLIHHSQISITIYKLLMNNLNKKLLLFTVSYKN